MKLLVIGSEGFIGWHCVEHFKQIGWDVFGCDLVDYPRAGYQYFKVSRLQPSFDEVIDHTVYDACINAAGNGSVPVSIAHPLADFDANCADVMRLLELLRVKNPDCKYLHISSAAVYGNPQTLPVREDSELKPLSPYGWHKLMSEQLCKQYHQLYNMPVAVVRPFSIYGPGLRKQLFWDLYQKCTAGAGSSLNLWGTGAESRDFIYITDVVAALQLILQNAPMQANIYNVANGTEVTIANAAKLFVDDFNPQIKVEFNQQQRAGDPLNWEADVTAISQLGYTPQISLETGIRNYVSWLRAQN